ncbi:MAG: transglycosylase domain-containing protein [Alphaproteobacteria bacterium]|nr:transglycosylase domain-containing protein [Alphaproteobacteria bacterium]MCB9793269.1 transglycosylase domain-containing protein [Alphaproteobacteria bacterium]
MRWRTWLKRLAILALLLTVVGASVLAILYRLYVVDQPGEHLHEANIRALIAQESTVLYRDGVTPIGVFFADEHRVYVEYEDIPQDWVHAITSAEDQRYFEHGGVDWVGFTRAMIQNVKAGTIVSGGSTLTMQTSENLFHPGARSVKAKLAEVLDTYRLEAHYSKEEILEFYANQFHVYGNGRGLGIAARYFFDKEVSELDLQECAFIAGLVKIPGRYNPWIGSTEEKRQLAREKAQTRVNYVLGRMVVDGHITQAQFDALEDRPIPFRKGEFRYDSTILMDEVERQLEAAPFPQLFADAGIENPSTAGLEIITTLDADVQRGATWGLWHHLTEVGAALEGLSAQDLFLDPGKAPKPDPNDPPKVYEFRNARVVELTDDGVLLDLGGFEGLLDEEAMDRAAQILAVAAGGDRNAKPSKALRASLREAISPDRVVWVSVRAKAGERWLCDLEARPELQGAVLVLDDGQVRAMVGGNDNRNFNRALRARRQLGSTWKVLVYNAALQLGWAPTDVLDNRRNVFPFSGTWYYPRPDHNSEDYVSMAWAGVRSENLATIWLLYHIIDRLNPEQVRQLAEATDLARRPDEARADYIRRIRDEHGVIATQGRLEEAFFGAVKEEVIAELNFTGHPEDATELRSMHYGRGFTKEQERVKKAYSGSDETLRLFALQNNFLDYEAMLPKCQEQHQRLVKAVAPPERETGLLEGLVERLVGGEEEAAPPASIDLIPAEVSRLSALEVEGALKVSCGDAPEGWTPVSEWLAARAPGEPLPKISAGLLLHGRVHASTIEAARAAVDGMAARVGDADPYEPEQLYLHPDFRQLLGMRYVAGLARQLGVKEEIPPVLSMPLGAVDVSLAEAAAMYQGFERGEAWSWPGEAYGPSAVPGLQSSSPLPSPEHGQPLLIAEIRDRDGELLYKATPKAQRVADPAAARLTQDILRNVVLHGTGRRAKDLIPDLELGGKTGTTNSFKNAAFMGYAPVAVDGQFDPTRAFTVAAYVGYDDNRPMTRNNIRIAGASGALPAWIGAVQALDAAGLLGETEGVTLREPDGEYAWAQVVDLSGLPTEEAQERQVLVLAPAEAPSRLFAIYGARPQEAGGVVEALPEDYGVVQEPEVSDDSGLVDPRLGAPPSVWDDIEGETE